MKVGVVGSTGYGAAELVRLILQHPHLELVAAVSHSQSGCRLDEIHPGLQGVTDLVTEVFDAHRLAKLDAVFLAVPHGFAAPLAQALEGAGDPLIVDLSRDHRHRADWIYGLAEWFAEELRGARRIAVPGCFATAISMAVAPFVQAGWSRDVVRVAAATGSTGLGVSPSRAGHHPERFANMKAYKVLAHQHRQEIEQFLQTVGEMPALHFVPVSAPLDRGIMATCFLRLSGTGEFKDPSGLLRRRYKNHGLVRIREDSPELRLVRATAYCDVAAHQDGDDVVVIAGIDNLVKGAAGQAVQCLNIASGWAETTGLLLAPAFP